MVRPATLTQRADEFLRYLDEEWAAIPRIAREWAGWTEERRLVFDLEWPIREDRMAELLRLRAAGRLSTGQCARLDDLLQTVERYRPTVEDLVGPTARAEQRTHHA